MANKFLDYELIDSGAGEKLERFGDKFIVRPASLAIWEKRSKKWNGIDAIFTPNEGWCFLKKQFNDWRIRLGDSLFLQLHLQKNGQIGVFPEHTNYLGEIENAIEELKNETTPPQVLNLFAYTGMASIFCRGLGAEVTHIDKAKAVLTWARENFELNKFENGIRFIPEDAIIFLEREKKRGHKYQIIIADPPNFSRLSKNENWDLDKVIIDLVKAISAVLVPNGYLFISSHQSFAFAESVQNLLIDLGRLKANTFNVLPLNITEQNSERKLPAGIITYGKLL